VTLNIDNNPIFREEQELLDTDVLIVGIFQFLNYKIDKIFYFNKIEI